MSKGLPWCSNMPLQLVQANLFPLVVQGTVTDRQISFLISFGGSAREMDSFLGGNGALDNSAMKSSVVFCSLWYIEPSLYCLL